jgi:hypothetical protein
MVPASTAAMAMVAVWRMPGGSGQAAAAASFQACIQRCKACHVTY